MLWGYAKFIYVYYNIRNYRTLFFSQFKYNNKLLLFEFRNALAWNARIDDNLLLHHKSSLTKFTCGNII